MALQLQKQWSPYHLQGDLSASSLSSSVPHLESLSSASFSGAKFRSATLSSSPSSASHYSVCPLRAVRCSSNSAIVQPQPTLAGENKISPKSERSVVRLALPSKGRMAEDTLSLLKDCQLSVHKPNPRQYIADIPSLPGLEVWFQRASDVVRKIRTGDVDLGIVGYDMVCEYGQGDDDLIIVHDALEFGECQLSIGIPTYGIFANVSSIAELAAMPQWSTERPLRIVTGYTHLGEQFIKKLGLEHVQLLTADGALEAAPAMGTADAILDLVSSGTTLRENNLKQIDGGLVLKSQGVLVASKHALLHRERALETTHEILERLEAHLRARGQFTVVANMRGKSELEVAERILKSTNFHGLQGPTISPVFSGRNGTLQEDYYGVVICVPKNYLYDAVKQLRKVGGSGVLVSPLTYIFDEEPPRWRQLLDKLKLQ
ncbi:hypothetical protein GOP47_0016518 [Adiantum capillus-veneris]|uniref:ATP phosphoribosyltransferase n=1 Tax=Adiantum capillus-veneris TaxID=13818 RepID=A0A9D4UHT6_ADICA|nr:hypothetical protein GOP47_0016518 [Adiantum capillus-veneris]